MYRFMEVLLTNILQIFHVNLQQLYPSLIYVQPAIIIIVA